MTDVRAAIILSRQPRHPSARCRWVQQTMRAIDWARRENCRVLTSVGLQTWELITSACVVKDVPIDLYIPGSSRDHEGQQIERLMWDFLLPQDTTHFISVPVGGDKNKHTSWMEARDDAIVAAADTLVPVAMSPDGSMARRLDTFGVDKERIAQFRVHELDPPAHCKQDYSDLEIDRAVDAVASEYLFHWTRTVNGPWPGERPIDFYRQVMVRGEYPRDAFATLLQILIERRLQASSRHMPGNAMTVSFSALPPRNVVPLMKWRARYGEMTFEPFGLGIRRTVALEAGIKPVVYYDPDGEGAPADVPAWRTQSKGRLTDWSMEREHRCLGDFELSRLDLDDLVAVTATRADADRLFRMSQVRVLPMFADPS